MLAVLLIEMKWLKENRSPAGAAQRQKYYRPLKIEDDVDLAGESVFLKKCQYFPRKEIPSSVMPGSVQNQMKKCRNRKREHFMPLMNWKFPASRFPRSRITESA